MNRKEQIEKVAKEAVVNSVDSGMNEEDAYVYSFYRGAEWADENPKTIFQVAQTIMGERDILADKLAIAVEAFEYLSTCPEPFVVSQINGGEYVTLSGYANAVLVELKKGDKK